METKKKYHLSGKHLNIYKTYVREWIQVLGLVGWEFEVVWTDEDVRGEVSYNLKARGASFKLGRVWYQVPTRENIRATALHECLHLLMAPFQAACEVHPHDGQYEKEETEHAIINSLTTLLMKKK